MLLFFPFFFWSISGSALAQISSRGWCPSIEAMKDFDINKFLGKWYETHRYYKPTKGGLKCVTYNWDMDENDTVIQIATVMTVRHGIQVTKPSIIQTPNAAKPGMLKEKYTWRPKERNLLILATDYKSHAIVYNCINSTRWRFFSRPMHRQYAWILTRDEKPNESVKIKIDGAIKLHKLDSTKFTKISHEDCEMKPQVITNATVAG